MIFDSSKYLDQYKKLGVKDHYQKAIEFLQTQDLKGLACGKYEIDSSNVYANVVEYTTVEWEKAKFEAHRDYTDIQYMIQGSEIMTYVPLDQLTGATSYHTEKDVTFFDNSVRGVDIPVQAGEFCIFNPQDGHKPKVFNGACGPIKKVIVKIREK